jgi:hypothetical protein
VNHFRISTPSADVVAGHIHDVLTADAVVWLFTLACSESFSRARRISALMGASLAFDTLPDELRCSSVIQMFVRFIALSLYA